MMTPYPAVVVKLLSWQYTCIKNVEIVPQKDCGAISVSVKSKQIFWNRQRDCTDYFCFLYPGVFNPFLYILASFQFGFSFQRPAVKSCQVGLSSVLGLIKRKTNSRFPRLGVARGQVFWCVGCCISFAPLLFSLSLSLSRPHVTHGGACSAVMLSDSLPACSLPTHMPTLGHIPHAHRYARITGLQELGGLKSKNTRK